MLCIVRHGSILAACFHPELDLRHPVIDLFGAMVDRHVGTPREIAAEA